MQATNQLLMVRPVNFMFNTQTAGNNSFQETGYEQNAQQNALEEFDNYVQMLKDAQINVVVVEDTIEPATPDSIFPNNWFTTHSCAELERDKTEGSTLVLYPMNAPNRRLERNKNVLTTLGIDKNTLQPINNNTNYKIGRVIDLTYFEKEGKFLEGTGSMILDRENKIAYCCQSPRTNEDVLEVWAEKLGYEYFLFEAFDEDRTPIYHTNVMMSIGARYAFVCLDAITNLDERERLIELLEENGKEIIEISYHQMHNYAGNMLVIKNKEHQLILALSLTAFNSLDEDQKSLIKKHFKVIVNPNLNCIEKNGGGSARCMLAELF